MPKVDVSKALDLKLNHNLSYQQIADIQGVWPNAIFKRIKDLLPTEVTKTFQDHRADIFSEAQLKLLSQVDAARLKKISVRDAVVSLGILYDKERIERGLATAIVSHPEIEAKITTLRQEREDIKAQRELLEREIIDIEGCVSDE